MCNLYTLRIESWNNVFGKSLAEVMAGENLPPPDVYPASPGIVITSDKTARKMTWGFPLVLKGKEGQPLKPKPVNNARTDKLGSPFWSASVRERRCLIPLDRFAEAEGKKGSMTRTWFSMPDGEQFHCAGIWRESAEWGNVYSMVMTEASGVVERIHDRMPVILEPNAYSSWLTGTVDDAKSLCIPYAGKLNENRTSDLWVKR
jgi:putative SOS response-associated peptidase YedK